MAKKPIKKVAKKAPSKKAAPKKAVKKAAKKVAKKAVAKKVVKKVAKKAVKKAAKKVKKALPAPKKVLALPPSSKASSKPVPVKAVVKGRIPEGKVVPKTAPVPVPVFDVAGFSKLSHSQKRVFMVTNAIKLLEKGLKVTKGDYIKSPSLNNSLQKIGQETDLKNMLENASDVAVCGVGVLLYADILIRGDYPVYRGNKLGAIGLADIAKRLYYFSHDQLKLIETAFECVWAFTDNESKGMPAIIFGQKFTDIRRRLSAILQNIVSNEGDFRP